MHSAAVAADGRRTSRKPCGISCGIINRNRKTVIKPNQMQSEKRTRETHPWGVLSSFVHNNVPSSFVCSSAAPGLYRLWRGHLFTPSTPRARAQDESYETSTTEGENQKSGISFVFRNTAATAGAAVMHLISQCASRSGDDTWYRV